MGPWVKTTAHFFAYHPELREDDNPATLKVMNEVKWAK